MVDTAKLCIVSEAIALKLTDKGYDYPMCIYDGVEKSAPSYDMVCKWLREQFNIHLTVHKSWSMNNAYYYEILYNDDWDGIIIPCVEANKSYDTAMEEGIMEALNLLVEYD